MDSGIYLAHKPVGPSSHAALKEFLAGALVPGRKPPRACHGGTLDPFAEGLLLFLVGPCTRLF